MIRKLRACIANPAIKHAIKKKVLVTLLVVNQSSFPERGTDSFRGPGMAHLSFWATLFGSQGKGHALTTTSHQGPLQFAFPFPFCAAEAVLGFIKI